MKNTNFLAIFIAFVFVFIGVGSAEAQQLKAAQGPAPVFQGKSAKIRPANSDEIAQLSAAMESFRSTNVGAKESKVGITTSTPPVFAIQLSGDPYYEGVTANAYSVNTLKAGTIFFGVQSSPDGTDHYYGVWSTEEDVPAGYVGYNLDNNHKFVYTQEAGVLTYKIVTLQNNTLREYRAERNFGIGSFARRQLISNGFANNTSTGPVFNFLGNFNGAVGVILQLPDSYSLSVPAEAITVQSGIVKIDMRKFSENYFFPTGDYKVTLVNSNGYSDNGFTVRLSNNGGSQIGNLPRGMLEQ